MLTSCAGAFPTTRPVVRRKLSSPTAAVILKPGSYSQAPQSVSKQLASTEHLLSERAHYLDNGESPSDKPEEQMDGLTKSGLLIFMICVDASEVSRFHIRVTTLFIYLSELRRRCEEFS